MLPRIPLSTLMLPPAYRDSVNREGTGSNRFRQGDSAALAAADRAPWRPARTASVLERQGKGWLVGVADPLFQARPRGRGGGAGPPAIPGSASAGRSFACARKFTWNTGL